MTAWQLHATEPDTWQVFLPWGQCVAAIRPQAGTDGLWEGAIRPRPDQLYPGVKVTHCPGKAAAMGVIGRELQQHWPEVAA